MSFITPENQRRIDANLPIIYTLSAKVRHFLGIDPVTNQKLYDEWRSLGENHNVMTEDGELLYHTMNFTDSSTGTNWIALSQSTITPARANTTLTGEIVVADGLGFERVQATTRTYNSATSTTTLSKTFTATGSITSILASALWNKTFGGVGEKMAQIANFGTGSGLLVTGDQLAVTWTATLGP
jgi:hypothetical protein